jgi:hypothetical protein
MNLDPIRIQSGSNPDPAPDPQLCSAIFIMDALETDFAGYPAGSLTQHLPNSSKI